MFLFVITFLELVKSEENIIRFSILGKAFPVLFMNSISKNYCNLFVLATVARSVSITLSII